MRVVVQKWGNSLAVRVPRSFARETGIEAGTEIEMTVGGGEIRLRPAAPKYGLEELVSQITPRNRHGEADWGGSVGGEAW